MSSLSSAGGVGRAAREPSVEGPALPPFRERTRAAVGALSFYALLILLVATAAPWAVGSPAWESALVSGLFALEALGLFGYVFYGGQGRACWRLLAPPLCLAALAFLQIAPLGLSTFDAAVAGVRPWGALSADPHATWQFAVRLLAYTAAADLLLRHTDSRLRLKALVAAAVAVGVGTALWGVARPSVAGAAVVEAGGFGQFGNRNHFAYLVEMPFGLLLGLLGGASVRSRAWPAYLALALLCGGAIALSNSRGGVLSLFGMIIVALMVATRRGGQGRRGEKVKGAPGLGVFLRAGVRLALGLTLAAVVLFGVVSIGGDRLAERFERTAGDVTEESPGAGAKEGRVQIWRATWGLIKEHPVAGVGFGGYWVAVLKHHRTSGTMPVAAHNDYLEVLASGGAVGAILFLWLAFELARPAAQNLKSKSSFRRAAAGGAIVGLSGLAIHSAVDFGLRLPPVALMAVALIAIATARVRTHGVVPPKSAAPRPGDGATSRGFRRPGGAVRPAGTKVPVEI